MCGLSPAGPQLGYFIRKMAARTGLLWKRRSCTVRHRREFFLWHSETPFTASSRAGTIRILSRAGTISQQLMTVAKPGSWFRSRHKGSSRQSRTSQATQFWRSDPRQARSVRRDDEERCPSQRCLLSRESEERISLAFCSISARMAKLPFFKKSGRNMGESGRRVNVSWLGPRGWGLVVRLVESAR